MTCTSTRRLLRNFAKPPRTALLAPCWPSSTMARLKCSSQSVPHELNPSKFVQPDPTPSRPTSSFRSAALKMPLAGLSVDCLSSIAYYLDGFCLARLLCTGSLLLRAKAPGFARSFRIEKQPLKSFPFSVFQQPNIEEIMVHCDNSLVENSIRLLGRSLLPEKPLPTLQKLSLRFIQSFQVLMPECSLQTAFPNLRSLSITLPKLAAGREMPPGLLASLPRTLVELELQLPEVAGAHFNLDDLNCLPEHLERLELRAFAEERGRTAQITFPKHLRRVVLLIYFINIFELLPLTVEHVEIRIAGKAAGVHAVLPTQKFVNLKHFQFSHTFQNDALILDGYPPRLTHLDCVAPVMDGTKAIACQYSDINWIRLLPPSVTFIGNLHPINFITSGLMSTYPPSLQDMMGYSYNPQVNVKNISNEEWASLPRQLRTLSLPYHETPKIDPEVLPKSLTELYEVEWTGDLDFSKFPNLHTLSFREYQGTDYISPVPPTKELLKRLLPPYLTELAISWTNIVLTPFLSILPSSLTSLTLSFASLKEAPLPLLSHDSTVLNGTGRHQDAVAVQESSLPIASSTEAMPTHWSCCLPSTLNRLDLFLRLSSESAKLSLKHLTNLSAFQLAGPDGDFAFDASLLSHLPPNLLILCITSFENTNVTRDCLSSLPRFLRQLTWFSSSTTRPVDIPDGLDVSKLPPFLACLQLPALASPSILRQLPPGIVFYAQAYESAREEWEAAFEAYKNHPIWEGYPKAPACEFVEE